MLVGPFHPLRGGIAQFDARLWRELGGEAVMAVSFRRQYPSRLFPGASQIDPEPAGPGAPAASPMIDSIAPWNWIASGARLARRAPRAVVFAHWMPFFAPAYGTIARVVGARSAARRILLCHNLAPHERRPADGLLTRYLLSACDGVLALSREVERQARARAPHLPIEYAPHPIVDPFARAEFPDRLDARARLGIDPAALVLLMFGYIRRYKGLDLAIEALALLRRSGRPARLVVAGEFYDGRAAYDRLARDLGVSDLVSFVDRYVGDAEVPGLFASADACLVPYRRATQSGVAKLALRYGVPVVASRTGGLAEDVIEGTTGFLFEPGDAAGLAASVGRLADALPTRDFAAAIGAERDRFGWPPLVAALHRLIEAAP